MTKKRESWIQIRVTEEEKKAIEKKADLEHLPVGTFIRKTILELAKVFKPNK